MAFTKDSTAREFKFPHSVKLGDYEAKATINGANWNVSYNISSKKRRKYAKFVVECNRGSTMRDTEADATITIDVGKEGDKFYSKHIFQAHFDRVKSMETITFRKRQVYRWGGYKPEKFDGSMFKDKQSEFTLTLSVTSVIGFRLYGDAPVHSNFGDPNAPHDRVLVMDDGTKFSVQSQLLSSCSSYFDALFNSDFAESKQSEIKIGEVKANEFGLMLEVLFQGRKLDSHPYIGDLLKMADRFDVPFLTKLCVDFLATLDVDPDSYDPIVNDINVFHLFEWADQYQLIKLQDSANRNLANCSSLCWLFLLGRKCIDRLSESAKQRLFFARDAAHLRNRKRKRKPKQL